jgi:hypothetical protein
MGCLAQAPATASQANAQNRADAGLPQPPAASWDPTPYEEAVPNSSDPLRLKRSGRHNSKPGTQPLDEDSYPALETASVDPPALPDLPVNRSDAIIVGTIAARHAYLSADHTSIYTEFKVQIEQLLKAPVDFPPKPGTLVDVERQGGSIQFSADAIISRGVANKTLPWTGKRYLLFLEYFPEGKDFSIVTGYRLEGPQVIPLDKTDTGPGSTEVVQDVNALPPLPPPLPDPRTEFTPGMTEAQLLAKVKLALASGY